VAAWLRRRHQQQTHPDTIVVDPPRTGLGRDLSQLVAQKLTQQLVYVSCDPVTLARDLQTLTSTGMQIVDIAVFDLFPQTHHVETVVRLARMNMAG
jgi:23S rRNA (uracil1939-C5)-methyltransferase